MSVRRPEVFEQLARQAEDFLSGWAQKEKAGLATFKRIWRLLELAYRPLEEFPDLALRFRLFEEWLGADGMELAASPLTGYQMEEVSAALEKLKLFLPRTTETGEGEASSEALAELAEKFVARLRGPEAIPPIFSAKAAEVTAPAESERADGASVAPPAAADYLQEKPTGPGGRATDDLGEDFKKLLRYELEYMEYYRKKEEHLFSVIGRLLDGLSARYHLADEVFIAHLLYFMQAQSYPVGPYLEKFRQIKSRVKK